MPFSKRGLPLIDMKMPAASLPIAVTHFRATLSVPLSLFETVQKTDTVTETPIKKGGTVYTDETGFPTVAPTAGTLLGFSGLSHPLYGDLVCASIRPEEGEETALNLKLDPETASADEIIDAARKAGIIDETDGTPLFEKLQRFQDSGCYLVADGTEAQPFASAAFCVLREQKEAVLQGLSLAARAITAVSSNIAVCLDNASMRRELRRMYPSDILYFAAKRYPVTKFTAADTENVCLIGVQALCALYDAVYEDKVVTSTVITVAGDMVKTPQNLRVAYGTPIQSLLDFCGTLGTPAAMIAGDAITGVALPDTACPVLPGMTCLLVLSSVPVVENDPCIGCGRCAKVCHKELLPYEIARRLENMHYERLAHLQADACDGCGACSLVCPAKRDVKGAVLYAAQSDGTVFLNWGGNDDG